MIRRKVGAVAAFAAAGGLGVALALVGTPAAATPSASTSTRSSTTTKTAPKPKPKPTTTTSTNKKKPKPPPAPPTGRSIAGLGIGKTAKLAVDGKSVTIFGTYGCARGATIGLQLWVVQVKTGASGKGIFPFLKGLKKGTAAYKTLAGKTKCTGASINWAGVAAVSKKDASPPAGKRGHLFKTGFARACVIASTKGKTGATDLAGYCRLVLVQ